MMIVLGTLYTYKYVECLCYCRKCDGRGPSATKFSVDAFSNELKLVVDNAAEGSIVANISSRIDDSDT